MTQGNVSYVPSTLKIMLVIDFFKNKNKNVTVVNKTLPYYLPTHPLLSLPCLFFLSHSQLSHKMKILLILCQFTRHKILLLILVFAYDSQSEGGKKQKKNFHEKILFTQE